MPATNQQLPDSPPITTVDVTTPAKFAPFSFRSLVIALLINPLLIFWAEYTEIVSGGADLIAMSLIMAVMFALVVIVVLNLIVKRLMPSKALTQAELMFIYVLNSATVGICGIGMMQFLTNNLAGAYYFAKPENGWLAWRYMVRKWAVPDPAVVKDYYLGGTSVFSAGHLAGWLTPILVWSVFIWVMLFGFYCVGTLLRKSWVERERLLFPIVTIPLSITENGGDSPLWRDRVFWLGFLAAAALECFAAVHYTISPSVPYFPIKPWERALNLDPVVGALSRPWSAMGTMDLAFYPLVIGLAFLLALDVSFSCWFFYLALKAQNILAAAFGFRDAGASQAMARIPYSPEQGMGAFVGLALISLRFAWPHLKSAFAKAIGREGGADDRDEPLSYRTAWLGVALSALFIVVFACALGLPVWAACLFVPIFFAMAIACSRLRAEAGLPWITTPGPMAHGTINELFGTPALGTQGLVAFSYLRWVDSDFRCVAMPQQIEAMKIADETRMNPRHMSAGILFTVLVAIAASWLSVLGIYYHYGAASAHVDVWRTGQGMYRFDELTGLIRSPHRYDPSYGEWMGVGLIVTLALSAMRARFVWWPFPVGYAAANSGIDWIWFPLLLGWLAKWSILRYTGLSGYRRALPFFIGLVLGDYVISGLWAVFYLVTGMPGYRTFPI